MKHLFVIFFCLLIGFSSLAAQEQLHISPFFSPSFTQRKEVTSVVVKDRQISDYKLTLFRSITVRNRLEEITAVEKAVRADAKRSVEQEFGSKNGKLYYGCYRLPKENGRQAYIFYRNNTLSNPAQPSFVLIYMEGTATMAELKRFFKK